MWWSQTYCLHCSNWLNTGSFPDATASCSGVLVNNKRQAYRLVIKLKTQGVHFIQFKTPKCCDLPALAVLHVGVGSSLQQGLCDLCHASHNFCRVFLRAEGADQVEGGLHRAHCGRIHLSWVPNQKDGGKLVPWRRQRNILKQTKFSGENSSLCKWKEKKKKKHRRVEQIPLRCAPLWIALCRRLQPLWSTMSTSALLLTRVVAILSSLRERARSSARSPLLSNSLSLPGSWIDSTNENNKDE